MNFYIVFDFCNRFFFVKSVFKSLFKSKRLQIIVDRILINKMSIIQIAKTFDVNRNMLLNRMKSKKFAVTKYDKKCRLLNETEKSTFLHFVDKYCKLNFSSKYEMIKDKIMKFRVF